jgi:asparagine synthase (glutamine-hydrolysing)
MKVNNGKVAITKYWDIPFYQKEEKLDWNPEKISEKIQELLIDAIRIRLRADVPVGAYLSGGLDSSGITSLIAKNFNNKIKTFGILFEEKDFDESAEQQYMVSYLNVDHSEIRVTNEQICDSFPEILWHCEKPILRTSPVPLYLLSDLVRQNDFKVVLTGEGADEVFGGYNIFREDKVRRFWARQPKSKFRHLLIKKLYPYIFKNPRSGNMLKNFFAKGLVNTDDPLYSHLIRWENTSRIKSFFSEDLKSTISSYNCYDDLRQKLPKYFDRIDSLSKAQYLEISLFMSNYLLSSQGDRVAMANSVEIRLPYLDHRIIDFMAKVPSQWKIRGLNEKYTLKKSFQGILPERIINRKKQPYRAPISQSLLNERNQNLIFDRKSDINSFFDNSKLRLLLKKLRKTGYSNEVDDMAISGILSTQIIFDKYITDFTNQNTYIDNDPDVPYCQGVYCTVLSRCLQFRLIFYVTDIIQQGLSL